MRAMAPRLNSWRKVDPRPPRRVRRSERHAMRQRARAALLALLLASCAPAARIAPDGRAIPVHVGEPASIDGVLLPVPLAAHLAESETCCRDCLSELEKQGESVSPWLLVAVGVAAAGAGAAGGYLATK